jgi:hypothetical protein
MPNTYLHYGEEEVDRKLRKIKGLEDNHETEAEKNNRSALEPKICMRCKERFPEMTERWKHPADSLYCTCGMVLDTNEAIRLETLNQDANQFTDKLIKNPLDKDIDLSQGIVEALYQMMKKNSIMLEEFKKIINF